MSHMVFAAPEARWVCAEPRRALSGAALTRMLQPVFGACRVVHAQPFADGLRNANFKVIIEQHTHPVVLRVYEHDGSLCRKELDLLTRVESSVPVPGILHAEPEGLRDLPPFMVMEHVPGITLRDLIDTRDQGHIAQAAFSAGQTLAAIGEITFAVN